MDPVDALIAAWRAELPEALGPASELSKRVMLLSARLERATRELLPGLGLTVAGFDIIVSLRRGGPPYRLKPAELARSLVMSSGGTTNVLHQLVARGVVRRVPDPDDARSTWIELTDEGLELARTAVLANTAAHEKVFAEAGQDAVDAAANALRAVFPSA
ncbi:MarR family transcriptional regulator [Actinorhabdospora filicis]|uniref:MarR family transcriptional regulator n=1 Tax=Actinorhabdospora filicis TaxID=1785913 RepID=A0A9W6WBL9_9ACTN|nr:MarR family transcriptional regulator [Actinorhabdospora filicis]GLZ80213.1 MarR family transcriptional regulator [Actinorhabdospora filicis]